MFGGRHNSRRDFSWLYPARVGVDGGGSWLDVVEGTLRYIPTILGVTGGGSLAKGLPFLFLSSAFFFFYFSLPSLLFRLLLQRAPPFSHFCNRVFINNELISSPSISSTISFAFGTIVDYFSGVVALAIGLGEEGMSLHGGWWI